MTEFLFIPSVLDHVCGFLGDHYDRCVGVGSNQRGHDGSVHHPEPLDAIYLELWVHHGGLVPLGTHLGGTNRVVRGHGVVPDHAFPVGVRVPRHGPTTGKRYVVQTAIVLVERRGLGHGLHKLDTPHQRVHVLSGRQVVGYDHGMLERVSALQQYFAPALRPQQYLQIYNTMKCWLSSKGLVSG